MTSDGLELTGVRSVTEMLIPESNEYQGILCCFVGCKMELTEKVYRIQGKKSNDPALFGGPFARHRIPIKTAASAGDQTEQMISATAISHPGIAFIM